jgi:hypothetical protein
MHGLQYLYCLIIPNQDRHTLMVSSDSMYNEIEVEPESEDSKCNDMPDQDSINICVIRDYYTNIKTNIHEELTSNKLHKWRR